MKVLIIGLGSIASKHILALRGILDKPIIYALRSGVSSQTEKEDVINILSLSELKEEIDFAIISNPSHLHLEAIEKVASLKVPLFIEKPLVHDLESLRKIESMQLDKHVKTYVACNMRFHPCIAFLKNLISGLNEQINEVNIYCGSYLPDWRPGRNYKDIYSAHESMGGGVHLDLFHEIDYACWLFGMPEAYFIHKSNKSSIDITAADYANILLIQQEYNISIILNYYRRVPKRTIEIISSERTITADLLSNQVKTDEGTKLYENKDFSIQETYTDQLRYFINCLKTSTQPMNSINESLPILKISLGL